MRSSHMATVCVVVFALVLVFGVGSVNAYVAFLSGGEQVPPVQSVAQAMVVLQLSADGTYMTYRVSVTNIADVSAVVLHLGSPGTIGPGVVSLFAGQQSSGAGLAPVIPQRISGVIAQGLITNSNLAGPLSGQPVSALVNSIQSGAAYVTVYTKAHPRGEVRGQIH